MRSSSQKWLAILLAGSLFAHHLPASDGLLQSVRQEVDEEPERKERRSEPYSPHLASDDDDCGLGELFGSIFLCAALAPFALPAMAVGDDFTSWSYFPPYPYADAHTGYLLLDESGDSASRWAMRVSAEYGTDFDGLSRVGTRVAWDTACRIGVEASWDHFWEPATAGSIDELTLGDVGLTYRFAQHERIQMSTGVGLRVLSDRADTDFGWNVTYGADVFPFEPLVLSGSLDFGGVGSATLFHGRISVGVILQHTEIFAGYDFWDFESVELRTPSAGIRLWF